MKIIIYLILSLLFSFNIIKAQNTDQYIFPDPGQKIILVRETGFDSLPVAEYITTGFNKDELAGKITEELSSPYFLTLIRLNQCTRNFVSDTTGPNILLLSENEGGFRRQGIIIKSGNNTFKYPMLNYVDLVINDDNISKAALSIYSHELGHVMMANIMGELPEGKSVLQHVSMGITDYMMAFTEGWGEHFQIITSVNIPQYGTYFRKKENYSNIGFLWHSNIDEELRLNCTLQNKYIFQKLIPDNIKTDTLDPEHMILLYHTSPIFNVCKLKNAQQMLSSEGMLSSIFYRINTSEELQNNYQDNSFYNKFLISPIPSELKPQDIFSPYENVMLKNFFVWYKIKDKLNNGNKPILIEFINEWCSSFPEDKKYILELFIKCTIGKTVSDEAGKIYEQASYAGITGDYMKFRNLMNAYSATIDEVLKNVITGELSISNNIGNEIWVEYPDLQVRTTLWFDKNKVNYRINLNTVSEYELALYKNTGLSKAKDIINARERVGFFKSPEEAEKYGFKR